MVTLLTKKFKLENIDQLKGMIEGLKPYPQTFEIPESPLVNQGSIDFGLLGHMHAREEFIDNNDPLLISKVMAKNFSQLSSFLDRVWLVAGRTSPIEITVTGDQPHRIERTLPEKAAKYTIDNQTFQQTMVRAQASVGGESNMGGWEIGSQIYTIDLHSGDKNFKLELGLRPGDKDHIEAQLIKDTSTTGPGARQSSKVTRLDASTTETLVKLLNLRTSNFNS